MHSVALHTCFSEPTTKIWMKIDPDYQQQKCSPGIPLLPQARALNEGRIGMNCPFSTFKPPYLCNGARYDKGYYWSLIENRICVFDWYQNERHWLTLKWSWTAIMHSVALHTCFWEPTTKIWMKIDPDYQQQKCSPGIPVFSKISFMQIFMGVRWRGGIKWELGGQ